MERKWRQMWGGSGEKVDRTLEEVGTKWGQSGVKVEREWGESEEKLGRMCREPRDPPQDCQDAPPQPPTDPQEGPGGAQKPPIRDPKSSQRRLRGRPQTPSDTMSLFGPFLFPFVSHLGPQELPQEGPKGGLGEAKRGPRASQERCLRRLCSKSIFR